MPLDGRVFPPFLAYGIGAVAVQVECLVHVSGSLCAEGGLDGDHQVLAHISRGRQDVLQQGKADKAAAQASLHLVQKELPHVRTFLPDQPFLP